MLFEVVIAGAELSRMVWVIVTVKLVEPSFPAESDAVHVTVVVPIGNKKPEDGEHVGPEVTPTLSDTRG
mgnify:CR=1 FL=1